MSLGLKEGGMSRYIPSLVLECLDESESRYFNEVFDRCQGYPSLQQLWRLMDEQWVACGCDPQQLDDRVSAFYRHPVWLLNGLFIEQDRQSLSYRQAFADWTASRNPVRIADFGGGFGTLARLIASLLPNSQVEVVEPYPHPAAIAMAADTPNLRFVPELDGMYDLLIATDVFEHVSDPIHVAYKTAKHLQIGGEYLIANCFSPVILCHLPQLFYLSICWDMVIQAMGLEPNQRVEYGMAYVRHGELDQVSARDVASRARRIYSLLKYLPKGRARVGGMIMKLTSIF